MALSQNLASPSEGALVVLATASDEQHPASNILDGDEGTFWITTGMFPHEFIVSFPRPVQLFRIKTLTKHVRKISLERCEKPQPNAFEKVYEVDLPNRDDAFQGDSQQVPNITARFLKVTLHSGWEDFASVHVFVAEGRALSQ